MANYEHPNSMEVQHQEIGVSGRTKFALHEAGQMGRLIVYPPVTIRWVAVLTGYLYPVEHLFLQIGISIQFTCFLISSSSVTRTEKKYLVSFN